MTTEALIDAVLDDAISEEDFQRLEALLEADPSARALNYDRLQLHTALELTF
ncbi:MAG: anti-sigma factor RsiW [Verrucomicrobiales bacterium]|jgi:anti-sigma factor RsiW